MRDPNRRAAISWAAIQVCSSTSASWVCFEDHTHSESGFSAPRRVLVACLFHTMYPVCLGWVRTSRTLDAVQAPTARVGSGGVGGGFETRSVLSRSAIAW
ncbi:hypothetical protein XF36_19530 [Pseudonocardia sp. HH130629-09]|nr:hypothetical protein XF36_19530 [Pseudonocardia sp. HH130629-09]